MNSQQLFYFNVIVGIAFVLYLLLGRRRPNESTRLNLKKKSSEEAVATEKVQVLPPPPKVTPELSSKVTILDPETPENTVGLNKSKNLAAFFIYNGHDWEAHSVLGVPQGANLQRITDAYQKLILSAPPEQLPFYEVAYNTLVQRRKPQGF